MSQSKVEWRLTAHDGGTRRCLGESVALDHTLAQADLDEFVSVGGERGAPRQDQSDPPSQQLPRLLEYQSTRNNNITVTFLYQNTRSYKIRLSCKTFNS